MSPALLILSWLLVGAQLVVPRPWAFVPLLAGALHLGNVEILGDLTSARLIILIGCLRALALGTLSFNLSRPVDRIFAFFTAWLILASFFRSPTDGSNPVFANLGIVWNCLGTFLYGRAYFAGSGAARRFCAATAFLILPLAAGMGYEKATGHNPYYLLGASSAQAAVRKDTIRASGPFRHPILAGTAGAASLPLVHSLLQQGRFWLGISGLLAATTIVFSAASSGPLFATILYLLALFFWKRRQLMKRALLAASGLLLIYPLVSGRGPWYLMARIDLVGGSTGWHRAYLIDRSMTFLEDWWLFGTDHTRNWMPTGVSWSESHSDITNYFLHLGVQGGLPVSLSLAALIYGGFRHLHRRFRNELETDQRLTWALGTSLAIHTVSFISVSYFDQIFVVFYLLLALILRNKPDPAEDEQAPPAPSENPKESASLAI
jgi:hypothetical protein